MQTKYVYINFGFHCEAILKQFRQNSKRRSLKYNNRQKGLLTRVGLVGMPVFRVVGEVMLAGPVLLFPAIGIEDIGDVGDVGVIGDFGDALLSNIFFRS